MSKYIIKSCPASYRGYRSDYECLNNGLDCKEVTNCLIKQIVEKCKDVSGCSDFAFGQRDKADEILSILEIQECE